MSYGITEDVTMTVSTSPITRILSGRLEYGKPNLSLENHDFSTGC